MQSNSPLGNGAKEEGVVYPEGSGSVLDDWELLEDERLLDTQLKSLVVRNEEDLHPRLNGSRSVPVIIDSTCNYRPPEPQIKILKRPSSGSNLNSALNNGKPLPTSKSLKEKEAEYNRARQRILGTLVEGPSASSSISYTSTSEKSFTRVEILKTTPNGISVIRDPKIPDGTNGFLNKRST